MHAVRLMLLIAACWSPMALSRAHSSTLGEAQPKIFTPEQRTEIVRVIREALKSDPSILRDAVTTLRADEKRQQEEAVRDSIGKAQPALTNSPGDPVGGNPQGEKTIVEFYDLQCPYCRRMLPVMQQLSAAQTKLRIIYKDIPIEGPASVLGARAVLAAQKQGGYFKLQEAIMNGPAEITEESLHTAADKAGLDWARLRRDMEDPSIQAHLDANLALSKSLGVRGTPTYVVGNTEFSGAMSLSQLEEAINVSGVLK